MTIDTRTDAERRYDAERDGTLYIVGAPPASLSNQIAAETDPTTKKRLIFRMADQVLGIGDELPTASREDLLIGHIDSAPVLASYMDNDTLYCAKVEWQGVKVSTDGVNYINLPDDEHLACVGDFRVSDWQLLAHANVIERLMTLAQRYPRFQDVPALLPPANPTPAIEVTLIHRDGAVGDEEIDLNYDGLGHVVYVDYGLGTNRGTASVSFRVDGRREGPVVNLCGFDAVPLEVAEQAARNLLALLDDPRVKAARAETA